MPTSYASCLIYACGWYVLLKIIYFFLNLAYETFFIKELPLLNRYGKGSWVIITGATDGIGWSFAQQFAARGFNIILVSRSLAKLQERQKELKLKQEATNKDFKVSIYEADFSKFDKI
jgi:17beta-estradiol 17-dehydrogenase / very-long-chain 3-oxoacyl-CoA reductase